MYCIISNTGRANKKTNKRSEETPRPLHNQFTITIIIIITVI